MIRSPAARHGADSSAEARREGRPSRRHNRNRSPRSIPPDREDHECRNQLSGKGRGPLDGVQDILRNGHSHAGISYPEAAELASSSAAPAENEDDNSPVQPHFPSNEKEKSEVREKMEQSVPTSAAKMSAPQSGDSAAALVVGEAGVTRLIDGPLARTYVDKVRADSSANPQPSRKRSDGLNVHVHPRNRTLSESVQAYLSRPVATQHPTKKSSVLGDAQSFTVKNSKSATDTHPGLLLRPMDGPTSPDMGKLPSLWKTSVRGTANGDPSTPNNTTSEQQLYSCRSQSCVSLLNCRSSTGTEHADGITQRGGRVDDGTTRPHPFLPSTEEASGTFPSGDRSPDRLEFPPMPSVTPLTRNANDALALEVERRPESVRTRHGESLGQGRRFDMEMGAARGTSDQAQPGDGALDLRSDLLGRLTLSGGAEALASLHDHKHGQAHDRSYTNKDTWPGVEVSVGAIAAGPLFFHGGERATSACEAGNLVVGDGLGDDASRAGSPVGSVSTDADTLDLETRLRMRARLRVRLAAMRGAGNVVGSVGSVSGLGPGPGGRARGAGCTRGPISGDRDEGGVRDGSRDKDKDKVEGADKVGVESDQDKERQREVTLRGMLMLRAQAARRG